MRFEKEINIYSDEAIIKRFKANETSVSVVQGKISALISESELVELQNSKATMYSKLASAVMDVSGLQANFSDLTTKYNTVSGQYTALDSKVAQYKAGVDGLSANVTSVQQDLKNNYSTTEAMNTAIQAKADLFSAKVNAVITVLREEYSTTSEMNTAIEAKANEIGLSVSKTYTKKTELSSALNRVDSLETWRNEAQLKITDSAIISTVTSSNAYKASVNSLIEQKADSIRLKADKISWSSTYSSMTEYGELTCKNATIEGTLHNDNGENEIYIRNATMELIKGNKRIGFIGTNNFEDQEEFKGLVFDLEYNASYMCWAAMDSSSSLYNTKLIYYHKAYGSNKKGLHFDCNTYANGKLWLANDVQIVEWSNGGCGVRGGSMTWCDNANNACVEINGAAKSFTIWGNTKVNIYSDIDMHGWDILNSSDVRMKTNIKDTSICALELLNNIELKEFDWIESMEHEPIGIIAQQLEEIAPELIHVDAETGKYSIKTIQIIFYLIKAIQELSGNKPARSLWRDVHTLEEKRAFCAKLGGTSPKKVEKVHEPMQIASGK